MWYGLGIDVGTSGTAAAVATASGDGEIDARALSLGRQQPTAPSVVFLDDDGNALVGDAAVRRGIERPDRAIREFKRRIGDDVPIAIGDLDVDAHELYALVATWVVERSTEQMGAPPNAITLTHPASWGGHRTGLIRTALAEHGLDDVTLLAEPAAAALHYATTSRIAPGTTIAVYDLGGGTFDAAVLRCDESGSFSLRGTPHGLEQLGGADFDDLVFEHVDHHTGGAVRGIDGDAAPLALAGLRRECIDAKEALSFDTEASIPVLIAGAPPSVRLTRTEFEAMIEHRLGETHIAFERAVASSDIEVADLATILLIGGSSRIPLVAELLSAAYERPLAVDADPKASISLGAAYAAAATALAGRDVAPAAVVAAPDASETPDAAVAPVTSLARFRSRGMRVTLIAASAAAAIALTIPALPVASGIGALIADGVRSAHPILAFPLAESPEQGASAPGLSGGGAGDGMVGSGSGSGQGTGSGSDAGTVGASGTGGGSASTDSPSGGSAATPVVVPSDGTSSSPTRVPAAPTSGAETGTGTGTGAATGGDTPPSGDPGTPPSTGTPPSDNAPDPGTGGGTDPGTGGGTGGGTDPGTGGGTDPGTGGGTDPGTGGGTDPGPGTDPPTEPPASEPPAAEPAPETLSAAESASIVAEPPPGDTAATAAAEEPVSP